MESSRTCPWPRGSLRTHFQVLGLGLVAHVLGLGLESQVLGLVKFSMKQVYWHRSEESSYDSCKDRYKCQFIPILPRCNNASGAFLSQVWCASTNSLTWRSSIAKGCHGTDFWVYAVCPWSWPCGLCPWPWESSPWPWSWPRGSCPWPCHLCPWLHHCSFVLQRRDKGIESHNNDIDLLRISKTMLFIHRIPSMLTNLNGARHRK